MSLETFLKMRETEKKAIKYAYKLPSNSWLSPKLMSRARVSSTGENKGKVKSLATGSSTYLVLERSLKFKFCPVRGV